MQADEKRQCAKGVWRKGSYRQSQCSKPGTLEHEGKWYCKTHHLPSKEAREKSATKCAYANKHYQCTTTVRDTKYCSFHEYDQIGRDALVELRKDKARLDKLDRCHSQVSVIESPDAFPVPHDKWTIYENEGQERYWAGKTIREAIDAMEDTNAK